jgi:hypothetical protein
MKSSTKYTVVLTLTLIVLLVWGIVGSSIAANIGVTCDIGLGEDGSILCWKWHKNTIGQIGDSLNRLFNK